jgi:hypothetical protein
MSAYDAFPDVEAVSAAVLRDAGVCGGRVYSSIPARPEYPLATVKRTGGGSAEKHRLDAARIEVAVWAGNKADARDAADAARLALHSAEGSIIAGVFVTGVADTDGLTWAPDSQTGRDRYTFTVTVYAHGRVG